MYSVNVKKFQAINNALEALEAQVLAELIKDGDIFEVSKPNNSNEILFTLKKNEKIDLSQIV